MHIRDEKELVRTRIKERAVRLTENDRSAESRSICRRVLENLPAGPQTMCAYMPMRSEPDIAPLITELIALGHSVFVPMFTKSNFEFRQIHSLEDLIPGKFGLLEPLPSAPLLDNKKVTVALLPGVAFDRRGYRLGRGNGGYDKWLQSLRKVNPAARVWGIALEHQVTEKVPVEPHDEKVDAIVTAREMIIL